MTYPKTITTETASPIGKPGQSIRGGYLVARRHKESGILIRIGNRPFEHGNLAEAEAQARILAAKHDDEFSVFAQVATIMPSPRVAASEPTEAAPVQADSLEPGARPVVVERRAPRRRKAGGAA